MVGRYILEKSKDNYDILKISGADKNIYIGSKYNEKREIDKFIGLAGTMTESDVYIVLGLGAGNHLKELLKLKHPKSKILVIDCEKEWAEEFSKNNELKDVTVARSNKEIVEFLYKNINEFNIGFVKVIPYANYHKIYNEEAGFYVNVVKNHLRSIKMVVNTRLRFADTWFIAKMKNIKYLSQSDVINDYKDKYKNKPAVIVSAGPSLTENINVLKDNEAAVVFCGGRTLKSLADIDVKPDYTVIVDPMPEMIKLVETLKIQIAV